jgi:arylsulfatase A-like enzyme
VSYADEQVGRLLSVLDRLGLDDRTLVIATSDHGESLTEHDYYFDHTVCLYDPSLRVPLIFRFPGGEPAGRRCTGLVQLIDVCPTILDYLGVGGNPEPDGASLLRQCVGVSDRFESEIAISTVFTGEIVGGKSLLSIRTPHHKYIRTSPWFGDLLVISGRDEFYDLVEDPGEVRDLAEREPPMLGGFRELGDEYWDAWMSRKIAKPGPISRQTAETLRSLGYLE